MTEDVVDVVDGSRNRVAKFGEGGGKSGEAVSEGRKRQPEVDNGGEAAQLSISKVENNGEKSLPVEPVGSPLRTLSTER